MTAPPTPHPSRLDLYASVTAQIIAAIEAGTTTYSFPWHHVPGLPQNLISQRPYRGVNTMLLWLTAHAQGYATPFWATFKQWRARGCPVRKGQKATMIVFWKQREAADRSLGDGDGDQGGERGARGRLIARAYHVFNAAQVEGFDLPDAPILPEAARDARAEAFFGGLPLQVEHDGEAAFYRPATDTVHLPPFSRFRDANAYYATRGHESVHATGARHRLDRDLAGRFGTETYAVEELIAELGAAFLCAALGLSAEPRPDHAGYIASWLKVLRGDTRAIFTAAGQAQAAVDWLQNAGLTVAPTHAEAVAEGGSTRQSQLAAVT